MKLSLRIETKRLAAGGGRCYCYCSHHRRLASLFMMHVLLFLFSI